MKKTTEIIQKLLRRRRILYISNKKSEKKTIIYINLKDIKRWWIYSLIRIIFEAQTFIRENYEVSAVSLREIRRFIILFQFFQDFLKKRKLNPNEKNEYFKKL